MANDVSVDDSWTSWCGVAEGAVGAARRDGTLVFVPRSAHAAMRAIWEAKAAEASEPSARAALARLIARKVAGSDPSLGALTAVAEGWAAGCDTAVRERPPPPSLGEVARSVRDLPREAWADYLERVRGAFFAQLSVEDFLVRVLQASSRRGAR